MNSNKFRVFTKFKSLRLLELNGRVPKSHKFHVMPSSYDHLPGNPSQDILLSQKFTLTRIDHQWIRTHIGHSLVNRLSLYLFNLRAKRKIEYEGIERETQKQELLLKTTDHKKLSFRRSHSSSGDSKKDSKDKKPISNCVKRKPVEKLSKYNKEYVHQEIREDLKKNKGVNRRKCGETPEELRKCLKTLQDVIDCVHPVLPYVRFFGNFYLALL